MFISDKVAYLELHKTGCTHIRSILEELMDGGLHGKHNQANPNLFNEGRKFLGSVRDPWEWYVSLWAYGCDQNGAIYGQLTKKIAKTTRAAWRHSPFTALAEILSRLTRDTGKWKDTYKDVNDAQAFRAWLYMMHDEKYLHHIGEDFSSHPLCKFSGLLTYRYLKLFCTKSDELPQLYKITSFDELVSYDKERCFIDQIIRNENLVLDLINALENFGVEISSNKRAELLARPKTNASSRKKGPEYYYDGESEQLIAQREQLIVEKFAYTAPSLRDPAH